ncbi:ParA family protein [Nocardiopsis terrae]
MTTSTSSRPVQPVLTQVNSDGTGWVQLPHGTQHVAEADVEQARVAILTLVGDHAAHQGQPVLVHTTDPDGSTGNILVAPDKTVTLAEPPAPAAAPAPTPPASLHVPVATASEHPPTPTRPPAMTTPAPAPAPTSTTTPVTPPQPSSGPLPQVWRSAMEEKSQAALPILETTAHVPQVRHIVVLSFKGGVGKTTTTVGLGQTLAQRQEDHVIALDGDHYGTLTSRFPPQTRSALSMAHLARDHDAVNTFVSLRRYLSAHARLQAMDAGTVTKAEFEIAAELAQRFADTVITDCRTDLTDPTAQAALERATGCVIVIEPAQDAMAAGHRTLEHLAHHHPELARMAVFVVCHRARRPPFRAQPQEILGRPVFSIPFDRHLSRGGVIEPQRLRRATRAAYSRVASAVQEAQEKVGRIWPQ